MDNIRNIEQAIIFVEKNLYEPISVTDVARVTSYSYFHFHRFFFVVMGETIGSYIRSRRLTEAAKELLYSENRIIDIALSLHFESHEAFTRAFKKRYGVTPKQYRMNRVETLLGHRIEANIDELYYRKNQVLQPEIVMVPDKIMVGIRFTTSVADNKSVLYWELFNDNIAKMKGILLDSPRYGVFECSDSCTNDEFNKNTEATGFIGIELLEDNESSLWSEIKANFELNEKYSLGNNVVIKNFKGGKYAKFTHVGRIDTIYQTYYYIWGTWSSNNNIKLDMRDDFECYTERFLGAENEKSQVDIYFPII
ncbi:GyrI-like domain-containing protein [Brassicibacter mesophilus]|uniref:GyrI-like domain-containing protein n=1 Tax=Brassicibacter mesophilus TaxID=745119 RepID=UPI003D22EB7B